MNWELESDNTWPIYLDTYQHLGDEDLVSRYQQRGDQGAIYCLFERYAHLAYGCFALQGLEASTCLQMVESLFMRLIAGEKLPKEERFREWLLTQAYVPPKSKGSIQKGSHLKQGGEASGWHRFEKGLASFSELAHAWECPWEEVRQRLIEDRCRIKERASRLK